MRSNRLCDAHNQQRAVGKKLGPIRQRRRTMPEFCTFALIDSEPPEKCGLPTVADGYCNGHYQQKKRRGEQAPLHTWRISQNEADELRKQGLKYCPACKVVKPLEEFSRSSVSRSRRATYCGSCMPDYSLMKRFNFPSVAALRHFRESRDFRCDICKRRWEKEERAYHIDHDRSCCASNARSCGKCVRGYLCGFCNTQGLAWYEAVGRTIAVVPIFEEYLARYESSRADR